MAEALTALVLAARSADPLLSLTDIGGKLRGARSVLANLDAVWRTEPLPEPAEPARPVGHDLEFESVAFRHGDRTVIDDVSLSVPQGQRFGAPSSDRRVRARAPCRSRSPGSTTWTRAPYARAQLKDAPIVLLDEVSSALDPVNGRLVHRSGRKSSGPGPVARRSRARRPGWAAVAAGTPFGGGHGPAPADRPSRP